MKRSRTVRFDLTEAEFGEIRAAAEQAGLAKGAFAARAALAVARGGGLPDDSPQRQALGEFIRAAGLVRRTTGCADPEAYWGHRNSNLPGPKGEMFFGYYLPAATMTREEHGPAVPEPARRMTLSSCELDPVRALAAVLLRMPAAGIVLGDILDDSGYAHRDAGAWAIPLRRAGALLARVASRPVFAGPPGMTIAWPPGTFGTSMP